MSGGAKEYASAAAQAVRLLCHATRPPGSLTSAQEVDQVLVELTLLAQRLPQAVDQLTRGLLELHNAGLVTHDRGLGSDALDREIDQATDLLSRALSLADQLGGRLNAARQITAHLTGGRS